MAVKVYSACGATPAREGPGACPSPLENFEKRMSYGGLW